MNILRGLLLINDIDPYEAFGAFLAEEDKDSMTNYEQLLKAPELKPLQKVDYREEDGVRLPTILNQKWKEREVKLTFAMVAESVAQFEQKFFDFLNFLKDGNNGWLTIQIPELNRSWRMYMVNCSRYEQVSDMTGEVVARFTVTFEEPQPNFNRAQNENNNI